MLFIDYTFELLPDGSIIMDPEIDLHRLEMEEGDRFIVCKTHNGRVMLRKVDVARSKRPLDIPL